MVPPTPKAAVMTAGSPSEKLNQVISKLEALLTPESVLAAAGGNDSNVGADADDGPLDFTVDEWYEWNLKED